MHHTMLAIHILKPYWLQAALYAFLRRLCHARANFVKPCINLSCHLFPSILLDEPVSASLEGKQVCSGGGVTILMVVCQHLAQGNGMVFVPAVISSGAR